MGYLACRRHPHIRPRRGLEWTCRRWLPSGFGLAANAGRNNRLASHGSWQSMRAPVNRRIRPRQRGRVWWTPSPAGCASGFAAAASATTEHRRRWITVQTMGLERRATDGRSSENASGSRLGESVLVLASAPWRQERLAPMDWGVHRCSTGRRTTRPWQQGRNMTVVQTATPQGIRQSQLPAGANLLTELGIIRHPVVRSQIDGSVDASARWSIGRPRAGRYPRRHKRSSADVLVHSDAVVA